MTPILAPLSDDDQLRRLAVIDRFRRRRVIRRRGVVLLVAKRGAR